VDYKIFIYPIAVLTITFVVVSFAWAFIKIIAHLIGFVVGLISKSHPNAAAIKVKAIKYGHIAAIVLLTHETYFAIYPDDDFYLGEFEYVTDRKPPEDAVILFKYASYPDFHGDYCSFSRMQLSRLAYDGLLKELAKDKRFKSFYPSAQASSGYMSNGKLPELKVQSFFERNDLEDDHHYEISFLENTQIDILLCVT
jgi:hypothetical protein